MLAMIFLSLSLGCGHAHAHTLHQGVPSYVQAPPPPRRAKVVHQHRHRGTVWVWSPAHVDKHGRHIKGHWNQRSESRQKVLDNHPPDTL